MGREGFPRQVNLPDQSSIVYPVRKLTRGTKYLILMAKSQVS